MAQKDLKDKVRARLAAIEKANGGLVTPDAVVADARNQKSPLHSYFEWDDTKAAHAHRLTQARALITSVMVTVRTENRSVQAVYYVRDPSAPPRQQGYLSIAKLRTEQDLAREAVVHAFVQARNALTAAKDLAAVLSMEDQVDAIITRIDAAHSMAATTN